MTPSSRLRLRKVIHGAIVNYANAHGYQLDTPSAVRSLEKRVYGAVYSAITTGQLEDTDDNKL